MDNLLNDELYNNNLDKSETSKYIQKFYLIMSEFLDEQHELEDKYLNLGLKTILHIAKCIFLYTKNIGCALYYCRLSITYYLEFLNQIKVNNVNSFVQLTLKDAIIFVYKKTIFNLKTDIYSHNKDDCAIFDNVFSSIEIAYMLFQYNQFKPIHDRSLIQSLKIIHAKTDISIIKDIIDIFIINDIPIVKMIQFISYIEKKNILLFSRENIYSFNYDSNINIKHYVNYLLM